MKKKINIRSMYDVNDWIEIIRGMTEEDIKEAWESVYPNQPDIEKELRYYQVDTMNPIILFLLETFPIFQDTYDNYVDSTNITPMKYTFIQYLIMDNDADRRCGSHGFSLRTDRILSRYGGEKCLSK